MHENVMLMNSLPSIANATVAAWYSESTTYAHTHTRQWKMYSPVPTVQSDIDTIGI